MTKTRTGYVKSGEPLTILELCERKVKEKTADRKAVAKKKPALEEAKKAAVEPVIAGVQRLTVSDPNEPSGSISVAKEGMTEKDVAQIEESVEIPSGSISVGKDGMSENDFVDLKASVKFATEVFDTVQFANLEVLNGARESLVQLAETQNALSAYKASTKSGFDRYEAISFSRLTVKHINEMGVTRKDSEKANLEVVLGALSGFTPSHVLENLVKKSNADGDNLSVLFDYFWKDLTQDGKFLNAFKILRRRVGRKPEARARVLTDYLVTQLLVFVEQLNLVQLTFLELVLAKSESPVAVPHKNKATLLTGSVDYAVLSSAEITIDAQKDSELSPDKVAEIIESLSGASCIEDITSNSAWADLKNYTRVQFTLIEEKRKSKTLADCEPQVVGEALALLVNLQLPIVLWCLSNGEDWIFGADDDVLQSISKVLKMLVIWTVCPVEDVRAKLNLV